MDEYHPITGRYVGALPADRRAPALRRIYTRTVVLWTVNIDIDTAQLWQHIRVSSGGGTPVPSTPVVRMVSTSTQRRGRLKKRLRRNPFRSVLSVDVQYKTFMPNLKISDRNTVQATGPGGRP